MLAEIYLAFDPDPISAVWLILAFEQDSLKHSLLRAIQADFKNDSASSRLFKGGPSRPDITHGSAIPSLYKGDIENMRDKGSESEDLVPNADSYPSP